MSQQLTSAASVRLERRIVRLFSLTLLVASVETAANAWAQLEILSSVGILVAVALLASILMIQVATWANANARVWIWVFASLSFFSMLLWPWSVSSPENLNTDFQPWIWWVIGMGVVSMGVVAKPLVSMGYLMATSATWLWLDTSWFSGGSDFWLSLQDSSYIFLFGGSVLGLFWIVRDSVAEVDQANTLAIQSAIEQARVDAEERERQRIDALVHDKVLNTLLLAAKAESETNQHSVVVLAKEAIESLRSAETEAEASGTINPLGLFRALRKVARQIIPGAEVELASPGSVEIPVNVAQALTEAMIQALDNISKHSNATSVNLRLDSPDSSSVLIELRDNGVGFRLDKIPRDRIGVRTSILKRLEAVSARGTIISEPGSGTLVRLEWSQ